MLNDDDITALRIVYPHLGHLCDQAREANRLREELIVRGEQMAALRLSREDLNCLKQLYDGQLGPLIDQASTAVSLAEELARRTVTWHDEPPPGNQADMALLLDAADDLSVWDQLSLRVNWTPGWRWAELPEVRRAVGLEG